MFLPTTVHIVYLVRRPNQIKFRKQNWDKDSRINTQKRPIGCDGHGRFLRCYVCNINMFVWWPSNNADNVPGKCNIFRVWNSAAFFVCQTLQHALSDDKWTQWNWTRWLWLQQTYIFEQKANCNNVLSCKAVANKWNTETYQEPVL